MRNKLTTNEFIARANTTHNNKYNYTQSIYTSNKDKIDIICLEHGIFQQTCGDHLRGSGCPKCSHLKLNSKNALTHDEFINKCNIIHQNTYDYSKTFYTQSRSKIIIICKIHGEFEQISNNHMQGYGCAKCVNDGKRKSTHEFITHANNIHNNVYDYSDVSYVRNDVPVNIICKIHGVFKQRPSNHLSGQGCPICSTSNGELRILNYLKSLNISYAPQYKFDECKHKKRLPFDFYLPDHNMCIEYDGIQHFTPCNFGSSKSKIEMFNTVITKDNIKNEFCNINNIKLLRIPYYEYDNIESILKRELT